MKTVKKFKPVKREMVDDDIFMKYEDTDFNGVGLEMAIDGLIDEYKDMMKKQIKDSRDQKLMIKELQNLWIEKIKKW